MTNPQEPQGTDYAPGMPVQPIFCAECLMATKKLMMENSDQQGNVSLTPEQAASPDAQPQLAQTYVGGVALCLAHLPLPKASSGLLVPDHH